MTLSSNYKGARFYLEKMNDRKIYALIYVFLLVIFSYLSWRKPSIIMSSQQGTVNFKIERSNGLRFERTIDFPDSPSSFHLANQRIVSYEKKPNHFILISSEDISYLTSPKVLFSIFFTVTALTAFVFYFNNLILRSTKIWPLFVHGGILGITFLGVLPGLYNFDSFSMLADISTFKTSEFHGVFFQSLFMSLFQLSPYPWTLTAFNIICITTFLFHLSIIANELKVEKYYWICCLIFYLYPPNLFLTFMSSRDPISYWLFFIVTIELYLSLSRKSFTTRNAVSLGLASGLTCLFRPETVYIFIPYLVFLALLFYRPHWKWFAYLSVFPILSMIIKPVLNFTSIGHSKISLAAYETTLIINPLSYILKNKYGELPPEIDQNLGPYFKNDYLIKYQSDHDIDPFHKGGVNFENLDSFKKFRSEALKIIFDNPMLFLENRLKLAQTMFNFGGNVNYIGGSNEYEHDHDLPFLRSTKSLFSFSDYNYFPHLRNALDSFLQLTFNHPQYLFKSYLIPFTLLIASLLLAPKGSVYSRLLILYLMRTALVIATAPGGYFKYNYALWLFCLFAFPCVIWERKLTSNMKMSENTIEV